MTTRLRPRFRHLLRAAPFLALAVAACSGADADADPAASASARTLSAQTSSPVSHAAARPDVEAEAAEMVVYKSPSCGCCGVWVDRMRDAGFRVVAHDVMDVQAIKAQYGLPPHLASCHTTLVDGYVVEGHVPADVVRRLLAERPEIAGIAVPGMPLGSPGMEVPSGRQDPYDVIAFTRDGKVSVYESR